MQIKFLIIEQSCLVLTVRDNTEWLNCGLINSYGKANPGSNWKKKQFSTPR